MLMKQTQRAKKMPARNLKSNPILFTFFLKNFTDFDNTVIDSILNRVKYTVSVVDIVKSV